MGEQQKIADHFKGKANRFIRSNHFLEIRPSSSNKRNVQILIEMYSQFSEYHEISILQKIIFPKYSIYDSIQWRHLSSIFRIPLEKTFVGADEHSLEIMLTVNALPPVVFMH